MKKWLYGLDDLDGNGIPRNGLDNSLLLRWVDKYLNPKDWFIEITGGEPGLYRELPTLLEQLTRRGFFGLVRNNGTVPIPTTDTFKRISAWHVNQPFPRSHDMVLLLENPEDSFPQKVQHCRENGVPFVLFPFTTFGSDKWVTTTRYPPKGAKLFTTMSTVFSSGAIGGCFTSHADLARGPSIHRMSPPQPVQFCSTCCNVEAIEYFISCMPDWGESLRKHTSHDSGPDPQRVDVSQFVYHSRQKQFLYRNIPVGTEYREALRNATKLHRARCP